MALPFNLRQSFSLPFFPIIPSTGDKSIRPSPLNISSSSSQNSVPELCESGLPPAASHTPSEPPPSPSLTLTSTSTSTVRPYRLCTLCHRRIKGPEYSFPSVAPAALAAIKLSLSPIKKGEKSKRDDRHFCHKCWVRIYDLSLCWTCGEVVHRGEERVGFGWCWWHWGCLGCLFCRVRCFFHSLSKSLETNDARSMESEDHERRTDLWSDRHRSLRQHGRKTPRE